MHRIKLLWGLVKRAVTKLLDDLLGQIKSVIWYPISEQIKVSKCGKSIKPANADETSTSVMSQLPELEFAPASLSLIALDGSMIFS